MRGRVTSRRAALAGMAALGAAAVLWPYTPKSRRSVPRGRVELTYWEKWTGLEGLALQRLVDRFNASQDRVWVHLVPVGDIDAKAMVAIGGGDPPDLVGLYTYNVPGYAEARAVMPLDEFPPCREQAAHAPGVRSLLWHEGRQWAGVNTCYTLALYFNKDLLRQAGLAFPPATVAELDAAADRLTVKDSQGRITRAGFLQNLPGWWPYLWPALFGGTLYEHGEGGPGRAAISSPACVEAFEWIAATARRHGAGATRAFAAAFGRGMHSAQDPFISGRLAMIVQGPWLANFVTALNPSLEFGVAPLPVSDSMRARVDGANPVGLLEADVLMIPRGCPHPEEAHEFLCFHQRQREQEQLALDHFKPSPFAEPSPEFLAKHAHPGIRVHNAIVASRNAMVLPRTRAWKQYSDLTTAAFEGVWGGADVTRTLTGLNARAQELIDAAAERRRQRGGAA